MMLTFPATGGQLTLATGKPRIRKDLPQVGIPVKKVELVIRDGTADIALLAEVTGSSAFSG